ncbi:MAG: Na+/H+ antiporter NhaA [Gemmataceae bacterium]|nr:Na+/H+ antiporter NhaA [Gemmataceae bacterium]MDW8243688.1 Na+/H+ antiporter NhaA [Thermogemmata sp.]
MAKVLLPASHPLLPKAPVRRIMRPLLHFLQIESASGVVLLICTIIALTLANLPATAEWYHSLWHTYVGIQWGRFHLGGELGHFLINDVLMTIFFFVVGLEIKRELVAGELRDPKKAALPVAAAIGGMVVPAAIYMTLQWGQPGFRGWGIPMATDIAFVVGVMTVLGHRIPFGLKILLLSLAIVDDIGAVIVIAIFYTSDLHLLMLGLAGLGFALTYTLNRIGVRAVPAYVVIGAFIWLAFYQSGVHPTIAGVLLGLLTPASAWIGDATLLEVLQDAIRRAPGPGPERYHVLNDVRFTARECISPLERLEIGLHPWVGFVIMPMFALANAGVHIELDEITDPIALAVACGLVFGKPIGIFLFSYVAVQAGVARLPQGVNWKVLLGGGSLAGIGFTMSLFVAGLAFGNDPHRLASGKLGTLLGSLISVIAGTTLLLLFLQKRDRPLLGLGDAPPTASEENHNSSPATLPGCPTTPDTPARPA